MVVCPGFIDIQSHSILPLMHGRALPLEDHAGRDDRDHGRGVDARALRRADRSAVAQRHLPRRRCRSGRSGRATGRASATGWRRWRSAASRRMSAPSSAAARCAQYAQGDGDGRADRRRAGDDAPRDGRGDGGRRVRRLLRADLPARRLRGTDEIAEVCKVVGAVRRRLHHAPALRGATGSSKRSKRRLQIGRRANVRGRDLSPEGGRARATGTRWPAAIATHRRGARRRAGRHGGHVPVHRLRHRPARPSCRRGPPRSGKLYENLRDPAMRAKIRDGGARTRPATGRRMGDAGRAGGRRCRSASSSRRTAQYAGKRLAEIAADARHSTGSTRRSICSSRRGPAHQHDLLHDDRGEPRAATAAAVDQDLAPTRAASTRPGRRSAARRTRAPTAPTRACSASTCARSGC